MLKRYFITFLGSLTAIWISIMLGVVLLMGAAITSVIGLSTAEKSIKKVSSRSVLHLKLDQSIEERAPEQDFYSIVNEKGKPLVLGNIINAIKVAQTDSNIEGIFIDCAGSSAGVATRQAIFEALSNFSNNSDKWIVAYADQYSQGDYYLASTANEIFINPQGSLDLRGLASGVPFFKNLLDKLGVEVQVVKVGTFKSAVEPFILTSMSEANKMQTQSYCNNIWDQIVSAISDKRNISKEAINQYADSMIIFDKAETYLDNKLVDGLKYRIETLEYLADKTGKDSPDDLNLVTVDEYIASGIELPNAKKRSKKIAVYYAVGDITESDRKGIASDRVAPDIIDLANDDDIDALVLRVNSGGGSAFASEQIWHALEVLKSKGKPFYVSMGDVAASGGYYISCGADKIYAQPTTITGSIGIYGMVPCVKNLVSDKIGINMDYVTTNTNSVGINIMEPMTPFQRQTMQKYVNNGYELFTKRCADGRHISQDSIKVIGEGRVWDGVTALNIGLVDCLGSLQDAIDDIATTNGYNKYQVIEYPDSKQSFWDIISQVSSNVRINALRNELGTLYPIYQQISELPNLDPLQARMEQEIIF